MKENILTPEIVILITAWICGTIYSTITKNSDGIFFAFALTILYGLYRLDHKD